MKRTNITALALLLPAFLNCTVHYVKEDFKEVKKQMPKYDKETIPKFYFSISYDTENKKTFLDVEAYLEEAKRKNIYEITAKEIYGYHCKKKRGWLWLLNGCALPVVLLTPLHFLPAADMRGATISLQIVGCLISGLLIGGYAIDKVPTIIKVEKKGEIQIGEVFLKKTDEIMLTGNRKNYNIESIVLHSEELGLNALVKLKNGKGTLELKNVKKLVNYQMLEDATKIIDCDWKKVFYAIEETPTKITVKHRNFTDDYSVKIKKEEKEKIFEAIKKICK